MASARRSPLSSPISKVRWSCSVIEEAFPTAKKCDEHCYEAELHRIKGELLLHSTEDRAEVAAHFRRAIDVTRRQEAKLFEIRATMSVSRLLREDGKREEAREMLSGIYGWFTEGFDTRDLKEAKALLEELS
jgi:predicted ATPase